MRCVPPLLSPDSTLQSLLTVLCAFFLPCNPFSWLPVMHTAFLFNGYLIQFSFSFHGSSSFWDGGGFVFSSVSFSGVKKFTCVQTKESSQAPQCTLTSMHAYTRVHTASPSPSWTGICASQVMSQRSSLGHISPKGRGHMPGLEALSLSLNSWYWRRGLQVLQHRVVPYLLLALP